MDTGALRERGRKGVRCAGEETRGAIALSCALAVLAVACGPSTQKSAARPTQAEGGVDDSEGRAFVDCTQGFRVEFPTTATGPVEHEIIDDAKHAAMVMRTGTGIGFSVTWTDIAPQKLTQSPMIVLHEIEKLRLGITGKLDEEREMALPGGEALEFSFHRAEGSRERAAGGRVLLFLKGTTLYQVAALGDAGAGARPDATVFLLSFRPTTCRE